MLQHTLTEGNSADKNIENSSNLIINTIYNLYLCFTSKKINIFQDRKIFIISVFKFLIILLNII